MIGDRKDRIRIQRRSRVKRADGGYDVTTATLIDLWAALRPVRAQEEEEAGRKRGGVTYLIEVDALAAQSVTADDALIWLTGSDTPMNIREVRKPTRSAMPLVIVAETGTIIGGSNG